MARVITINFWCPMIPEAVEKLHAAGVMSATFTPPWNPNGKAWALKVKSSDIGWPAGQASVQLFLNVGWILGVIGASKDTLVDFNNEDET